jgi:hypothetical protein
MSSIVPIPSDKDLFDNERDVIRNVTNYNTAYLNFVLCSNRQLDPKMVNQNCSNEIRALNPNFDASMNKLQNSIQVLDSNLKTYNIQHPKLSSSSYDFDISMNKIMEDHNKLKTVRNQLDLSLKNLYDTQDSTVNIYKNNLDMDAYANIMWTVLASSVIFYIFIK